MAEDVKNTEQTETAEVTETKPLAEPEKKEEAKPAAEPEKKEEAKPAAEPEKKEEAKPAAEPEKKEEAKPAAEPEKKEEAKPAAEPEKKEEAKPAAEPEKKAEVKPAVQPAPPRELTRAEKKAAAKAEKQAAKEAAKAEREALKAEEKALLAEEKALKKAKKEAKRRKRRKHLWWKILLLLALLAAFGYGINLEMTKYFTTHFYPNTIINGENCSTLTVEEVKEKLQYHVEGYRVELVESDGNKTVLTGNDIGMRYEDDGAVERFLEEQQKTYWFLNLKNEHKTTIRAASNFDQAKFRNVLAALPMFDRSLSEAPQDAYIQDNGMQYEIVPETVGTLLKTETALDTVISLIAEGETCIYLEDYDLYEKPAVTADNPELITERDRLNTYVSANFTYDYVDQQFTMNSMVFKDWLVPTGDGDYTIDYDQAYEWVRNMAYETDTFGLSRDFTTSTGRTIHLQGGGDYGWCINKEATTEELISAIMAGYSGPKTPVYLYTAQDRSSNDIGGTYVEVCISTQTMWCYKDYQLVCETPVVTGNHSTGHDTPAGSVWAVDAKKANYHMKTFDVDVDFWLPFNDACGIHDATWRYDFGGNIYMSSGSHGCVNTPYDAVEKIFDVIEIGHPVVVYYSEDDVVGYQPTQDNEEG